MKKLTVLSILLLLIFQAHFSEAGSSRTQSYKMSVTIPAIVGINVPSPEAKATEIKVNETENMQIVKEQILRDQQPVILQTVVLK